MSVFKDQLVAVLTFSLFLAVPQLPLIYISDTIFELWMRDDLTRVEELLTEEIEQPVDPHLLRHARALAYRALVRSRLKQWDMAIDDAKKVFLSSFVLSRTNHHTPSPLMLNVQSLAISQTYCHMSVSGTRTTSRSCAYLTSCSLTVSRRPRIIFSY